MPPRSRHSPRRPSRTRRRARVLPRPTAVGAVPRPSDAAAERAAIRQDLRRILLWALVLLAILLVVAWVKPLIF